MRLGELKPETVLNGRYQILHPLGRGGMGTVYLAEHLTLETEVAVKEIRGGQQENEEEFRAALKLCEQEAHILVRLNHPNLPRVNDAFVENNRFYLVMEYLDGRTLEQRMREPRDNPLTILQIVEYALQVTNVLTYLHGQNPPIIFRDLKPANIMVLTDGSVRLIDFGIARKFQPDKVQDTMLLGSIGYSPPEQFGKSQTDVRSDIFAFGATLHHLLTGRDPAAQPFKFQPAQTLNPSIPTSLSRLLEACLALDVNARPANMKEVAMRLAEIRDELTVLERQKALSTPADTMAPMTGKTRNSAKIASAKLEALEANRPYATTTGQHAKQPDNGRWVAIVAAIVLLAVLGGSVPFLMKFRPNSQKQTTSKTTNPDQPEAPKPAVSWEPAVVNDLTTDGSGNVILPIHISGIIKEKESGQAVVTAYFYDRQGNPIRAKEVNNPSYAGDNGKLRTYPQELTIGSKQQTFSLDLLVGTEQMPASVANSGIQVQVEVVVDGELLGKSALKEVPTAKLTGTSPTQPNPNPGHPENPPPDSSPNPPGNDPSTKGTDTSLKGSETSGSTTDTSKKVGP